MPTYLPALPVWGGSSPTEPAVAQSGRLNVGMGLSYRVIAAALSVFGVGIERMSAWRDEQVWAEQLRQQRKWKPVRVLGLDVAYVRAFGEVRPVLVAVDVGAGPPVAIGYVDEYNPEAVWRRLEPLVKCLRVSVVVTDDLVNYRTVAQKLDLEHQICQFHVHRWMGHMLKELQTSLHPPWLAGARQSQTAAP